VSPTTAEHVRLDLGAEVDAVLDDGPCTIGVESTIVDCSSGAPVILRLGGCPRERVEELVGSTVRLQTGGERVGPGTLAAHYAPRAQVVVVPAGDVAARAASAIASGARVGLLALVPPLDAPAGLVVLDPPADVDDYARVLYSRLRDADRRDLDVLLTVPPACEGLGAAVEDRLRRAAVGSGVLNP